MVTRAFDNQAPPQTIQLCDYCHQKPKFSTHQFCGKTCAGKAAQAPATLCNNCHKKPKFQNFDYCGRTCASQAGAGSKKSGGTRLVNRNVNHAQGNNNAQVPNIVQGSNHNTLCINCHKKPKFQNFDYCGKTCASQAGALRNHRSRNNHKGVNGGNGSHTTGNNALNTNTNNNVTEAIDPTKLPGAQLVQASLPLSNYPYPDSQLPVQIPSNNPFLNAPTTYNHQPTIINNSDATTTQSTSLFKSLSLSGKKNNNKNQPQLHINTSNGNDIEEGRCIIVGCKKSVRYEEEFRDSDFCSMKHREQAVTSGLLSPCIMCLVLPQSDSDYFCSRTCRDESLNKKLYDDDEDEDDVVYEEPEWNGPAITDN